MTVTRYIIFSALFLALIQSSVHAQPRAVIDFNKNWKFFLGNDSSAINSKYDDKEWRTLNLPHDWSIEGEFSQTNPATSQEGALPAGIGWYRKKFVVGSKKGQNVIIEFDGVYQNSEVWINGHYLGKRPNGYISFYYDISSYLKQAPSENIIVVKVDNSQQPNSRWYTGSGIYRNVRLVVTNTYAFVAKWGTYITSYDLNQKEAKVNNVIVLNSSTKDEKAVGIRMDIYDASNKLISGDQVIPGDDHRFTGGRMQMNYSTNIGTPHFWTPDRPYLYKAVTSVFHNGKLIDAKTDYFGIRYFSFDSEKGFFLNGKPTKIKGVCLHHDLGALGAAFNIVAAKRQLNLLKEMGCNAIRTAHNPPDPGFLDLCDQMGFLVMDEAFDMWQKRKNKFDYHLDFPAWHLQNLADMIKRDRNHPSIILWSIGNEIREQFDSSGIVLTKELVDVVKKYDGTRPVISALTENIPTKNFIYQSGALDVLGFNYKLNDYNELPSRFPGKKFLATETASALATRGVYELPSDSDRIWPPDSKQPFTKGNTDLTVSSYDNTYAYWGASHERSLLAVNSYDFLAGCFVWSGFDFLGEPVPYPWPARSSYYGIIDLAGFPKDVYYMYQSVWTSKPVLHIFPHWNWLQGELVDVWAYYNNADEVELYLNGQSLGKRIKSKNELHVMWRVPFEPGTIKAISRKNGKIVLTQEIKTAGSPARIEMKADKMALKADGYDLCFVTVKVKDSNGNLVPDANNLIEFSVNGAGIIAGTDNGFQADTISLKSTNRNCWKGMSLAIIQSSGKKGNITLKATSMGLRPAFLALKTND